MCGLSEGVVYMYVYIFKRLPQNKYHMGMYMCVCIIKLVEKEIRIVALIIRPVPVTSPYFSTKNW